MWRVRHQRQMSLFKVGSEASAVGGYGQHCCVWFYKHVSWCPSQRDSVALSRGKLWRVLWNVSQKLPWKFLEGEQNMYSLTPLPHWSKVASWGIIKCSFFSLPVPSSLPIPSHPFLSLLPHPHPHFNLTHVWVPRRFLWAFPWREISKAPQTRNERTGVLGETLFRGTCVKVVDVCTELVTAAGAGIKVRPRGCEVIHHKHPI